MNKVKIIISIIFSVILTYLAAYMDFAMSISKGLIGLPFGFASFDLLGGSTNNFYLVLNIIFWFLVVSFIFWIVNKIRKAI